MLNTHTVLLMMSIVMPEKNIEGEKLWYFFVSVAMINGNEYPVVFKLRTIDSDIRTQIYEIYTTKEDGSSRNLLTDTRITKHHHPPVVL